MTMTTEHPAPSWEALVNAALLGTERRRPPVARPGREPAAALLDSAAISTVRRRAGLRPAAAGVRPSPAPEDTRPPLPAAARRRLASLLADRTAGSRSGGGRRGTAPDLTELLPQWLTTANRRGYRAPEALLPALLDAARSRTDLRQEALVLGGPRALWLARLNPDWKFALRGTAAGPVPGRRSGPRRPGDHGFDDNLSEGDRSIGSGTEAPTEQVWQEGLFTERVALLTTLRRHDPAAALALLGSTWARERAEDRLMFTDSLRTGLSADDEPFLEQALADRSRNVRATAAELLSALPGSALSARMAERAAVRLSLDRDGGTPKVTVDPPRSCDAGMQRDGVTPKPPAGCGERAWWLGQLVESAPLSCWQERFGGLTPAEIVALPVTEDWQADLHAAWCRAAVRQRDRAWSRALLGAPGATTGPTTATASLGERAKLLAALEPYERAAWVAEFIAAHGLSEAFQLLGVCAVPWAAPLGRAVVDALDIARDAGSYPWSFSGVMGLAERCLDPDHADRLELLTATPDETESASPGAGGYWSEAFQRLVSTLRLRAAMHRELEDDPADPADHVGPRRARES
ncbi:DUF5691 domain-containing protein [Streptomyces sp. NPDC051776]|uniref:DUF5691 domain-containing protein n=1 Tax=Streptomyces sp. NPDC051776 TaxID=3155414 RepID=UPI00341E0BA1